MRKLAPVLVLMSVFAFLLSSPAAAAGDAMLIYGKGYSLMVSEPPGWSGVTEDAAKYRVNVYFPMSGYDFNSSPVLMYARVLDKNGNTVGKNLELDMLDFSKRKKSVEFFDFSVANIEYEQAAKKYVIDRSQSDYLCYVDPGPSCPLYVIFVLTGPTEVSETRLKDFQTLVQSFKWLNLTVREAKPSNP